MKIGIELLFVRPGKVGGGESYIRNIVKGLQLTDTENQYVLFTSNTNDHTFEITNPNFKKVKCNVDGDNRVKRIIYTSFVLPKAAKQENVDVLFFPYYMRCIFNIKGIKIVSNIHDLQYIHHPDNFSLTKKILFRIFYPLAIRKSDSLVCISQYVYKDILEKFPDTPKEKLRVIYNGIDFEQLSVGIDGAEHILRKYGINSKKYLLSVASLVPHKNTKTLLHAFSILKQKKEFSDLKLLLVGIKDKSTPQLLQELDKNQITKDVLIPGFISNYDLSVVYHHALVFASTSVFEGFGMPPVEAMYRQIPTITTTCTSLPEVTLHKANYYEEPFDAQKLAEKIMELIIHRPPSLDELREISEAIESMYNLNKVAKEYIDLFQNLAENSSSAIRYSSNKIAPVSVGVESHVD